MGVLRRLRRLDAQVLAFRREGEPAEAYLRRFAAGKARDSAGGVQVRQALVEHFQELDSRRPDR